MFPSLMQDRHSLSTPSQIRRAEKYVNRGELFKISTSGVISVSSSKKQHGQDNLTDGNNHTYWQSDGAQPHKISIQYGSQVDIRCVCLHISYAQDESFTPFHIELSGGTSSHDMVLLNSTMVIAKTGWVSIYDMLGSSERSRFGRLEISLVSNNDGGRDSRVRGFEVYSSKADWHSYAQTNFHHSKMMPRI